MVIGISNTIGNSEIREKGKYIVAIEFRESLVAPIAHRLGFDNCIFVSGVKHTIL